MSNMSRLTFFVENSFIFSAFCSGSQDKFVLVINDSLILVSNIDRRTVFVID
jgi:hypothetical protein